MKSLFRILVLFLTSDALGQTPWKSLWSNPKEDIRLGSEGGLWKSAGSKNASAFGLDFHESARKLVFNVSEIFKTILVEDRKRTNILCSQIYSESRLGFFQQN